MGDLHTMLPVHVVRVMEMLRHFGYQSYIVGGAVRDLLLGNTPQDYDIATDARPEAVARHASQQGWRVVDRLGHNFGVVTVVSGGQTVEVAAFRGERYGSDSHRPERVWYARHIEEDLARRDFTVNAMAMDMAGTILDPFGGRNDLQQRLLRTVGDPDQRFEEDALRMFRACRFSGQLGFIIEDRTFQAIGRHLPRVAGLSAERVRTELDKTLLGADCRAGLNVLVMSGLAACSCRMKEHGLYKPVPILPELMHLAGLPQNPEYHVYDGWRHTLEAVHHTPPDLLLRWAALLHDVAKGMPGVRGVKDGQPTDYGHDAAGARLAGKMLARFQMAPAFVSRVVWLVARHMRFFSYLDADRAAALRWVRAEALSGAFRNRAELQEAFQQLAVLATADIKAAGRREDVMKQAVLCGRRLREAAGAMPVHTRDLSYSAASLAEALDDYKLLGRFLKIALRRVQDGNLVNEEKTILAAARKWAQRQNR
jgi:tRNA nucleotidyltransferase (CCA-adding enzyme)